jgi:CRP/FNR family transcriptional regulator
MTADTVRRSARPSPSGSDGGSSRIRLRRRQSIPLDQLGERETVVIESGCLLVEGEIAEERSQVVLILFPGDGICRQAVPPLAGFGITATVPSTLVRLGPGTGTGTEPSPAPAMARLAARTALHTIVLNRLTAEERVATLLLELTLRLGLRTPAGCSFVMPISRTDMARFLALNPDTLSRLMTRLRSAGVVARGAGGLVSVPDVGRLAARSPLATAVARLSPGSACGYGLEGVGAGPAA